MVCTARFCYDLVATTSIFLSLTLTFRSLRRVSSRSLFTSFLRQPSSSETYLVTTWRSWHPEGGLLPQHVERQVKGKSTLSYFCRVDQNNKIYLYKKGLAELGGTPPLSRKNPASLCFQYFQICHIACHQDRQENIIDIQT